MTKQEIGKTIEGIIIKHGFEPTYYNPAEYIPHIAQSNSDYCGIIIIENCRYNAASQSLYETYTAQARVCCMNPNATTDELRAAADQIIRGAALADDINALKLTLTR